ncbi:MAG: tetratricopeptide repeat protein [Acidobacteriota bacterium]
MILTAQDLLRKGETVRGLKVLELAKEDKRAAPYALSILAVEHLRTGQPESAILELQESIRLLPGQAANHSNLALALAWKGRSEQGLIEARKALQLDPSRPKTRYVLGQILLDMGRTEEAEFHLKAAAQELAGARELLVKYFHGQ